MGLRKLRPMTPSQRHTTMSDYVDLTVGNQPEKSLLVALKRSEIGRASCRERV